MKFITKLGYRILISIVLGGVTNEALLLVFSEDPNRSTLNLSLFFISIYFIVFSVFVYGRKLWYYYFGLKKHPESSEDVLDDGLLK